MINALHATLVYYMYLKLTEGITKAIEKTVGSNSHGGLHVAVDNNRSFSNLSIAWENGVDQPGVVCLEGRDKRVIDK